MVRTGNIDCRMHMTSVTPWVHMLEDDQWWGVETLRAEQYITGHWDHLLFPGHYIAATAPGVSPLVVAPPHNTIEVGGDLTQLNN